MGEESVEDAISGRRGILLVGTAREWFKPALEAVLVPEGFTVLRAGDGDILHELVSRESPDLVLVDESLSASAPALIESLLSGPLSSSVPLVLYSSDMSTEHLQAEALEAGAWEVLREPVRSEHLIAAVRRLLGLSDLIRRSHRQESDDWENGLLTRSGLARLLPRVEALAIRHDASVTCAVVGPTKPASGERLDRQRRLTADLCTRHVRKADLCGWMSDRDVAIVAFGTTPEDAAVMVRRLDDLSSDLGEDGEYGLSAGIVDIRTRRGNGDGDNARIELDDEDGDRVSRSLLDAAYTALEDARRRGGGIETVEVKGDTDAS